LVRLNAFIDFATALKLKAVFDELFVPIRRNVDSGKRRKHDGFFFFCSTNFIFVALQGDLKPGRGEIGFGM